MLKLKLQYFAGKYTLMGRADSLEKSLMMGKIEDRRKRGWPRIRWLDGQEFEQSPEHSKGQGNLVCCSPWGHKVSEQLTDWTTIAMESMTSLRRRTAKWSVVFCTQTSYPTPENCMLFEERKTYAAITCGDWALSYGFHETMHPIAYLSWVLMALQVAVVGVHSSDSSPDRHGISWMKQDQRAQTRCMRKQSRAHFSHCVALESCLWPSLGVICGVLYDPLRRLETPILTTWMSWLVSLRGNGAMGTFIVHCLPLPKPVPQEGGSLIWNSLWNSWSETAEKWNRGAWSRVAEIHISLLETTFGSPVWVADHLQMFTSLSAPQLPS